MNMAPEYQGMRWFKCDLHMHTPADLKCWRGKPLGNDYDAAAKDYIRRCYEFGLEVIAITDHNFKSKSFIPKLRNAISLLSPEYGYQIVLFPGFEINADVGKGMHVLGLFEPDADVEEIDHALTACGVPMPRQKPDGTNEPSIKRLTDIIKVVQKTNEDGLLMGIVICPHPKETGIFDNDRISEWLQQQEWKNPALLAVEVPKPVDQLSQGWQTLFGNGKSCHEEWKRPRCMAAVMSSDAKALTQEENAENYIGRRFTWIKMSKPSIESFRQAFLDPESRISLEPSPPQVIHTHVKAIRLIGSKFLQDQAVSLSPHLNCIIGGRGSGKSLLFESLRLGLRGEVSFEGVKERDHVAARQVSRLRGTFKKETKIELDISHGGLEDLIVVDGSGQPARIEGRVVEDPPTVFRRLGALIFSQEEITQLADPEQSFLQFIDGLAGDRLDSPRAKAQEIIDRLKSLRQKEEIVKRLQGELASLKQEEAELARQLTAKAQVQEELKRHRVAQEAKRYLDSLLDKSQQMENRLQELAEEFEVEPPPLGSRVEDFPKQNYFREVEEKVTEAYGALATAMRSAAETFRKSMDQALLKHPEWKGMQQAVQEIEKRFQQACSEKGLTPQEAEQLRETEIQHRAKHAAAQAKKAEIGAQKKQMPDMVDLLKDLTDCWRKETEERKLILDEMVSSKSMPRTQQGEPILKTTLHFAGDNEMFLKKWREISPDARSQAGRVWDRESRDVESNENIGDQLFEAFRLEINNIETPLVSGNPIHWFERNLGTPEEFPSIVQNHLEAIKKVRQEQAEKWFNLLLTRIPDAADLVLLRNDGTEAGSFQKKGLSTGQKNTAILSLLLARGSGPVFIDQPEDELDSEFLFRELVPMFRKSKIQRQLVIVTHNANLPVNGDAELVYALEARGGQGVCRTQGGLDRMDVTRAVLDIMEGSEEAFIKRKEKYHF